MTVPAFDGDEIVVADRLMTTTRSIRKRLDLETPVDPEVITECIDVAVHAPSAENQQNWRWVVVTDSELRSEIAKRYQQAWMVYRMSGGGKIRKGRAARDRSMITSVEWLADHLEHVPAIVIPCVLGRPPASGSFGGRGDANLDHLGNVMYYGSVMPAVWSFQMALRSRGLGSVLTCMHLPFEAELSAVLGIPRSVTQICLLPVAHVTGSALGPARRSPALIGMNGWGHGL